MDEEHLKKLKNWLMKFQKIFFWK